MTTATESGITGRTVLRGVFRSEAKAVIGGSGVVMVHQICEALVPVAIGLAVDRAVGNPDGTAIAVAVAGVLGLFVVLASGGALGSWIVESAAARQSHRLRVLAARNILHDHAPGERRGSGEMMAILTLDTRHTGEVLQMVAWLVAASIGLITSAAVLLRIDLMLGIGVLVALPVLVLGMDRLGPWIERRAHHRQQTAGIAAGTAAEFLAGLRPLRGFGGVPEAVRRYRRASRLSLDAAVDASTASAVVTGAGLLGTGVLLVGTSTAAVAMAVSGRISLGELVTVVAMASFVADPVRTIADCVQQLSISRASAGRVATLLQPHPEPTGTAPPPDADLELAGVVLPPLRGLDLRIRAGEIVGLAATDPAAADAVVRLLSGRAQPESGSVSLGGLPLTELDREQVRSTMLVEPHTVHLLGETLREAMDSDRGATDPQLLAALAAAGAGDLLADRAEQLELPLQDRGSNLSGGQRQRLALARALAAQPPVLVLRDPLSAVDGVTEQEVARRLRDNRARDGRRTLVITSSPPLLAGCDRVVYLDSAGIACTGTHLELTERADYAAAVLR